jgi:DNA polymerase elongation subunit (family B)
MSKISNEVIENFLQGSDPQQYIVAIEAGYSEPTVTLVINDPETGKRLEKHPFKPFLWFKHDITSILYGGNRLKRIESGRIYGVKIKELRTSNSEGFSPERLEHGYKYMATCNKSYNDLINFFKAGGVDVFHADYSRSFVMFRADEQFLIQTGKRLFKGMDDYDDVHRFQFDLETTGLFASKDSIFQIGVRDNRKLEHVLEVKGDTLQEQRNEERATITKFFKIIDYIQPDIITGYNSENFDWPFLFERAERLSIPITEVAITLNRVSKIKRKPATVKFGGETEHYQQTNMYGYNIMDISHAVRRAMAINSEIKSWGLKYITQYSEIAKPNRVYVPGDKIGTTWKDKVNQYAFNDENGDWYMITDKAPLKEGYVIKKGDYIVQRYLCDDLWETEQIDNIFNQASFLIAKMLPTSFQRSSTMGTAGQWKLIMAAWSYENGLGIPETQKKRDFTGGLSRLLELGFARDVYKLDYAALYPKTQITHKIFPDLDISGVMEGILTYVVDTRDKFKFLTGTEKKTAKKYETLLKEGKDLTPEQKEEYKKLVTEHKALSNLYDKKQLPLKILANSWFGSYGAPYIFNWGDTDSAEETTCRGRQYLRLMVKHFTETHGFRALVGDTDGFNFAAPANINEIKYVAKGSHWKTIDDAGKELVGIHAALAEFNEIYMEGRMGLDLDDVCSSTINFARKNYANDIGGKIKLVGNSVKSKKMSVYIEEFLGKGIRMLLDGDGHSFINYYYEYVDKIYNYQIPLVKIASKAKIKSNIADYKKKANMVNKAGNPMPKQAHMELAMQAGLDVTLGDTLFYINTGTSKSHGDLKTIYHNKMTKKQLEKWYINNGQESTPPNVTKEVQLNCKLIDPKVIEHDFEMIKELEMLKKSITAMESEDEMDMDAFASIGERIEQINSELYTDEYNVAKYLDAFNKKIRPLLVCFNLEVRGNVLLDIVKIKDKATKKVTEKLKDRMVFTIAECELVSGISNKPGDQDSYEDLMRMEDKEIKFWMRVNKLPNNMTQEEWDILQVDYVERMRVARIEGIENEKNTLDDIFKHLELQDLKDVITKATLPVDVFVIADVDADDNGVYLVSRKWEERLCSYDDIFKYKADAIERDKYYQLSNNTNSDNRYELYLEYLTELQFMSGETTTNTYEDVELLENTDIAVDKLKEAAEKVVITTTVIKKKRVLSEGDEDEENEFEEDEDGNLTRTDEILHLDDEYDDTFGDMPEGYVVDETASVNGMDKEAELQKEVKPEEPDEWGF